MSSAKAKFWCELMWYVRVPSDQGLWLAYGTSRQQLDMKGGLPSPKPSQVRGSMNTLRLTIWAFLHPIVTDARPISHASITPGALVGVVVSSLGSDKATNLPKAIIGKK